MAKAVTALPVPDSVFRKAMAALVESYLSGNGDGIGSIIEIELNPDEIPAHHTGAIRKYLYVQCMAPGKINATGLTTEPANGVYFATLKLVVVETVGSTGNIMAVLRHELGHWWQDTQNSDTMRGMPSPAVHAKRQRVRKRGPSTQKPTVHHAGGLAGPHAGRDIEFMTNMGSDLASVMHKLRTSSRWEGKLTVENINAEVIQHAVKRFSGIPRTGESAEVSVNQKRFNKYVSRLYGYVQQNLATAGLNVARANPTTPGEMDFGEPELQAFDRLMLDMAHIRTKLELGIAHMTARSAIIRKLRAEATGLKDEEVRLKAIVHKWADNVKVKVEQVDALRNDLNMTRSQRDRAVAELNQRTENWNALVRAHVADRERHQLDLKVLYERIAALELLNSKANRALVPAVMEEVDIHRPAETPEASWVTRSPQRIVRRREADMRQQAKDEGRNKKR